MPRTAAAIAALLLVGCSAVGPNYRRPAANVPAAYKEASAQGAHASGARQGAALASDRWWEIYGDPTLDTLVAQVRVSNQSLAAAAARMREAQYLLRAAGGPRVPSIAAGTIHSGPSNRNDFGAGVSWEPDFWGQIRRDVQAHRASAEASADELAAATLSLQAQVVQGYFDVRQHDAAMALLQRTIAIDREWVDMTRNRYAHGQASSVDVDDALARLGSAQQQLVELRRVRARLEHALAVMLGKPPADFALAAAPFDTRVPSVPVGLPATLLRRRPDIAARERQMAAASARIGVSKAQTLPSVKLFAGLGVLNGPTATADVQWPLFSGGRLDALVGNARSAYREAEANYRQTVLDALREVEDGLVDVRALARSAALQTESVQAAREAERVARNQYRAGLVDYPAVVSAVAAAVKAEQDALDLHLRRLDASVSLIEALGGGWQVGGAQDARARSGRNSQRPLS